MQRSRHGCKWYDIAAVTSSNIFWLMDVFWIAINSKYIHIVVRRKFDTSNEIEIN